MLTVNVKSALYGMQAIAPHFIARGRGQIVNVSSMLSRVPFATFRSAYNAAKAALNALTANARVDLAREHPGIQVTLVMPGLVRTDFQRNAARRIAADAGARRRAVGRGCGRGDRRRDRAAGRRDLHQPAPRRDRAELLSGCRRLRRRPPPREDDADVRADAARPRRRAPDDPRQGQRDGPRVLPRADRCRCAPASNRTPARWC